MKNVMTYVRRGLLLLMAASVFGSAMGMLTPPIQASAQSSCDPPPIMFGRWRWCGYFYNRYDDEGPMVRPEGIRGGLNRANEFYDLIWADYHSGDPQKITSSAFIVRTMTGLALPSGCAPNSSCKGLAANHWAEFQNRLNGYASTSQNGITSVGPNGRIVWFYSDYMHCGDANTYYQDAWRDIAPYIISKSNTPYCNVTSTRFDHIVFYDNSGNVLYKIRRLCMNPIGNLRPLADDPPQYNLTASITASSGGAPLTSGSYVQAGDPITFNYNVHNNRAGTATGISCQAHANTTAGWRAIPSPPETTGPNPPGVTCRSTFGPGNTSLGVENIASSTNDTSVCRSLIISPRSPTGGESAAQVCVYVSSRPYMRVYGGDVSAGNPQSNACSTVTQAGIVGWSKDLTSYSGAGTQYAALAINSIHNFSTNLGNAAGPATTPSGLAFANTGASGDRFGGSFGALPCIADYYAARTGPIISSGNLSSLSTGSYQANGPITISGNINPNNRIVLYVNGDVTIGGSGIRYPGTWNVDSMPMFMVVASGNIYIDNDVTQMDGIYVAQATAAPNTGIIYTCTNGSTPYTINAAGTFNNQCNNNTLTVNGAFIAKQVQFMRTKGTVKQSSPTEASGSSNQAEVFNYSPAVWMAVPPDVPVETKYDSITSLPPIL